jgi:hypothetical protein
MYKDLKYLNEECKAEKDAPEKEVLRGCPHVEMLHDTKCTLVEACRSPRHVDFEVDENVGESMRRNLIHSLSPLLCSG